MFHYIKGSPDERFWAKVDRQGDDDCWMWLAGGDTGKSGRFRLSNEKGSKTAERFAWMSLIDPDLPLGVRLLPICGLVRCVNPRHRVRADDVQGRFWSKVDKSGECWVWTAYTNEKGYGRFQLGGSTKTASRLVYEWEHGSFPDDMDVCHVCDNPPCVRPAHLFLGTKQDNADDKVKKGRQSKGSKHGRALLNETKVLEIVDLLDEGKMSQERIGKLYGITQMTVSKINVGKNWKELVGPYREMKARIRT